jgi:hypothetical protein
LWRGTFPEQLLNNREALLEVPARFMEDAQAAVSAQSWAEPAAMIERRPC